jgi:hypothetical protein
MRKSLALLALGAACVAATANAQSHTTPNFLVPTAVRPTADLRCPPAYYYTEATPKGPKYCVICPRGYNFGWFGNRKYCISCRPGYHYDTVRYCVR